ncbi:MAG: hypothetical protein ABI702_15910 [Burkholderiales bacterium]
MRLPTCQEVGAGVAYEPPLGHSLTAFLAGELTELPPLPLPLPLLRERLHHAIEHARESAARRLVIDEDQP